MDQGNYHSRVVASILLLLSLLFCGTPQAAAQTQLRDPIRLPDVPAGAGPRRLTIEQAIALAELNYPEISQRIEEVAAARANVTAQKLKEYVPEGLSTWQQVAATHNKLTQILFSNPVLPPNPGPGLDESAQTWHGNVYSGTGFLLDWTPIDFGLHKARIDEAKARLGQTTATMGVTRLDVAVNAALSFMNVVRGAEQARAQQANVRRMEIVVTTVRGLVDAGLRPGADVSLAEAQLAEARNGLIESVQQRDISRARLAAAVGEPSAEFEIVETPIEDTTAPPVVLISTPAFSLHPLAVAQRSAIGVILAQNKVIFQSNMPVIHWMAGLNWRGSGLDTRGQPQKKDAFGWLPAVNNWNVGLMINWTFTDFIKNHEVLVSQRHVVEAERHRYRQIIQNLESENLQSQAMIRGAVALAENTPIQLRAAQEAELRLRTRYETGLSTIAEVAEAERQLTLAQVQAAIARIGVWQALLAASNAHGDIQPFLRQIAAVRTQQGM